MATFRLRPALKTPVRLSPLAYIYAHSIIFSLFAFSFALVFLLLFAAILSPELFSDHLSRRRLYIQISASVLVGFDFQNFFVLLKVFPKFAVAFF